MNNQTLAGIKAALGRFHNETADIYRTTESVQSDGSVERSQEIRAQDVPCRLFYPQKSNNSAMREIGGQERMMEEYRISLESGTTLAVDDEVRVGGVAYQVVRIVEDMTQMADVQAIVTRRR